MCHSMSGALIDFDGQYGLAGAGLALDQEGALQGNSGVDGDLEIVGGDVVLGAFELHWLGGGSSAGKKTRELRG